MLGKDDFFEIVFDPGTDKVEKLCLGPVSFIGGDTGVLVVQPNGYCPAELSKSIDFSAGGQPGSGFRISAPPIYPLTRRCMLFVPFSEGIFGRNSDSGCHNHAMHGRKIIKRKNLLPATDAEHGSADQEQRNVGPNLLGDTQAVLARERLLEL